jgi:hypothetical protein
VWLSWAALAAAVVLRFVPLLEGEPAWQRAVLLASGALSVVSACAFAVIVFLTLLHPDSRAEATAYFFLIGAAAFVAQACMSLAFAAVAVQRGDDALRPVEAFGVLHLQLYGFIAMFMLGVATRAIPTFSGLPRPELQAKALALALAGAVVAFVVPAVWVAEGTRNAGLFRLEAAGFASLGPVFLAAAWLVGIFRPAANRAGSASRQHLWFIRSAFAWLAIAGGLATYFGVRAAVAGDPIASYGIDAVRHTVAVGVASMMIMGMALLVVPEFAIRRMRHPSERAIPLLILVLLNAAVALRVGAAVATPHWLSLDRYWPAAIAGGLGEGALLVFAALFAMSWLQKQATVASAVHVKAPGAASTTGRP